MNDKESETGIGIRLAQNNFSSVVSYAFKNGVFHLVTCPVLQVCCHQVVVERQT